MSQEPEKQNKSTQWLTILVVVIALAIVAYFLIRFVISFLWWIIAFLAIALLIINRKMVMKIFNYIQNLYKKNKVLGVGAGVGAIVAFTPFLGFLLLKTIWDFRKAGVGGNSKAQNTDMLDEKMPIEMTDTTKMDDTFMNTNPLTDNKSKFPPTDQ